MNTDMVSITEKEFKQIASLLYRNFGINLTDNKPSPSDIKVLKRLDLLAIKNRK